MDTTTKNINTIPSENDELPNDNYLDVNYGLIAKLHLNDVCFMDTNREVELSINYKQPLQMSSQYNILSLKRNIDPSTTNLYV